MESVKNSEAPLATRFVDGHCSNHFDILGEPGCQNDDLGRAVIARLTPINLRTLLDRNPR